MFCSSSSTIVLTMLLTPHIVSIHNTKHNCNSYKILKTIYIFFNLISSTKGRSERDIARKTSTTKRKTYLISWDTHSLVHKHNNQTQL